MSTPAVLMGMDEWRRKAAAGNAPTDVLLRKYIDPARVKVKASGDAASRRVSFTISTGAVDREGDTIAADGWALDSYLANPVVLFAHRYSELPIGKAVSVTKSAGKLKAVAEFMPADMPVVGPLAEAVYRCLKEGYLRATSVGFRPLKSAHNDERGGWSMDFLEQELLEFSVVPVPANPEALMDAAKGFAGALGAGVDLGPLERAFSIARSVTGRVLVPVGVELRAGRVFSKANEKILRDAHAAGTEAQAACMKTLAHMASLIDQLPETPEDPEQDDDEDDDQVGTESARAAEPVATAAAVVVTEAAPPAPAAPLTYTLTAEARTALAATAATAALGRRTPPGLSKE